MKKEIKIIIAGVIIFLFLVTVTLVSLIYKKGGFALSLLWDTFIIVMIDIGISIIVAVIVYMLYNWVER